MNTRALSLCIALTLLSGFLLMVSFSFGSIDISFAETFNILFDVGPYKNSHYQIIHVIRMPKGLTALICGAALAVSGLLMQTLFRNPLAGPFVLGINSGASFGVALLMLTTHHLAFEFSEIFGGFSQVIASCIGAALVMSIILFISQRMVGNVTLLIIGLMLGYLTGSLVSLLTYFSTAEQIQSFALWSMGSFDHVTWTKLKILIPFILTGIGIAVFFARELNVMLLGERYAKSMGLSTHRVRIGVIVAACLLAGSVTSFCGPIAFLGIAVPHIVRRIFLSSNHIYLIPGCVLTGCCLTLISDLVATVPGSDTTLPLNAVTSLIGAPIVIWVILKGNRQSLD